MEECPFCGAKERHFHKDITFDCGTTSNYQASGGLFSLKETKRFLIKGGFNRSKTCYEHQLAQQADLLSQALEVLQGLLIMGDKKQPRKLDEVLTWRENDFLIKTKAQALLPKLKAIKEKK